MSDDSGIFSSHLQCLTFKVDDAEYSVDIMSVREIKGWVDCTRLPNMPDYLRGVMNLRGAIIPIFDLRCRFGEGLTSATPKHVVIILATRDRNIGVLVDAVSDIITVEQSALKPAPRDGSSDVDERFVDGLIDHDSRMIVHLNIENLFHEHTLVMPPAGAMADLSFASPLHA